MNQFGKNWQMYISAVIHAVRAADQANGRRVTLAGVTQVMTANRSVTIDPMNGEPACQQQHGTRGAAGDRSRMSSVCSRAMKCWSFVRTCAG